MQMVKKHRLSWVVHWLAGASTCARASLLRHVWASASRAQALALRPRVLARRLRKVRCHVYLSRVLATCTCHLLEIHYSQMFWFSLLMQPNGPERLNTVRVHCKTRCNTFGPFAMLYLLFYQVRPEPAHFRQRQASTSQLQPLCSCCELFYFWNVVLNRL